MSSDIAVEEASDMSPSAVEEEEEKKEDCRPPLSVLVDHHPCLAAGRCVSMCAAYGKVCPHSAREAGRRAVKDARSLLEGSKIFLPERLKDLPRLRKEKDLVVGDVLGRGGFSTVSACDVVGSKGDRRMRYAIKSLKLRIAVDPDTFRHGASDLVTEALFLHALNHEGIVKLRGIHDKGDGGDLFDAISDAEHFFLVLERVDGTLDEHVHKVWKSEMRRLHDSTNFVSRHRAGYKHQVATELGRRLRSVASPLAGVFSYLHDEKKVIYRDLKPENVGILRDEKTNELKSIKLFDFGLARELKGAPDTNTGKYNLTGQTGSRRYMAPEVANGAPYDLSVDVYSFGILLWELVALEKPFDGYSSYRHQAQVVDRGERPHIDASCWPIQLQWLLKSCWSEHSPTRPSFGRCRSLVDDVANSLLGTFGPATSTTSLPSATRGRSRSAGFAQPKESDSHANRNKTVAAAATVPPPPPPPSQPIISPPAGGFKSIPKPLKVGGRKSRESKTSTSPIRSRTVGTAPLSPGFLRSNHHQHHGKRLSFGGLFASPRKEGVK